MHNSKADIGVLYSNFGVLLRNGYCTMLASQIIDNGYKDTRNMVGNIPELPKPHSLVGTVKRYLGVTIGEEKETIRQSFIGMKLGTPLTKEQLEYAASDTQYLDQLYEAQQVHIRDRQLENIIKLENTLTPVLVKIEFKGCLIDQRKHRENIKNWSKELKNIEARLDKIVMDLAKDHPSIQSGRYTNKREKQSFTQLDMFGGAGYIVENLNLYNINYSSPKQIEDLFTRVNAPKPVDDNGKVSFGENPINVYTTNNPDSPLREFVETLLEFREYSKLLGTYGSRLFNLLDNNGRLRSSYGQAWTDTLRLNSAEIIRGELGINNANIPKRGDIRSIFIADPGYSFVDCDQSGQEVLIAGSFSQEPLILKSFNEGFDLHSFLGSISYSLIFNRPTEIKNTSDIIDVDKFQYKLKDLRQEHKSALFAIFYGGGAKRIQNVLNKYLVNHIPANERLGKADEIARALKDKLKTLTTYLKGTVEFCKKHGYVIANKLGLRRYFDDPEKAYGEIMNFGIQGTGALSIKIALINIDKWFMNKSKELQIPEYELGWIAASIYDQNLCCLNDKYLELAPDIQKIMGESLTYFLTNLTGSSDMQIKKFWSK